MLIQAIVISRERIPRSTELSDATAGTSNAYGSPQEVEALILSG
jgi:hypothetical protein